MAEDGARKSACVLLGALLGVACERVEHAAPAVATASGNRAGVASSGSPNRTPSATPPMPALDLDAPTPEPRTLGLAAAPHAVGERAESRDYFMTLVRVATCEVEPHFRPAPGRIKLGLEVLIEARGVREVPANPFLATLRDAEDRDYRADLAGCTPTLRAERLAQADKAHGFITFEVPADATGLTMTYAPFVVGVGLETLSFALGR